MIVRTEFALFPGEYPEARLVSPWIDLHREHSSILPATAVEYQRRSFRKELIESNMFEGFGGFARLTFESEYEMIRAYREANVQSARNEFALHHGEPFTVVTNAPQPRTRPDLTSRLFFVFVGDPSDAERAIVGFSSAIEKHLGNQFETQHWTSVQSGWATYSRPEVAMLTDLWVESDAVVDIMGKTGVLGSANPLRLALAALIA